MTLRHLLQMVQRCHLVLHPFELTVPVEPYLMLKNLMEHEFTKELDAEFVGDYNADFNFKMGSMTVCPKSLPIDIQISVDLNGNLTGYIFNNGGGNDHKFCKLYHNGTINGAVDEDGKLKGVNIKQKDKTISKPASKQTQCRGTIGYECNQDE